MKKKKFYIGIATAIVAFITQIVLFHNKYGIHFFNEEPYLKYMIPIWSVMISLGGYELARIYFQRKESVYSANISLEEKSLNWIKQRNWMLSNALLILSKILFVATPGYIIAYLDHSKYLNSSLFKIILLLISAITLFIVGKFLRINKFSHK